MKFIRSQNIYTIVTSDQVWFQKDSRFFDTFWFFETNFFSYGMLAPETQRSVYRMWWPTFFCCGIKERIYQNRNRENPIFWHAYMWRTCPIKMKTMHILGIEKDMICRPLRHSSRRLKGEALACTGLPPLPTMGAALMVACPVPQCWRVSSGRSHTVESECQGGDPGDGEGSVSLVENVAIVRASPAH